MNDVIKTLFYSYPSFEGVLKATEKLVYFKAISSYKNNNKTLNQMEEILELNDRAARLKQVKSMVEELIDGLLDDEKQLIEYKYFHYHMPEDFDFTSRKYFRRQLKLEKKIDARALSKGIDEAWFKNNLWDVYFLRAKYLKLVLNNRISVVKNSARDRNL